MEVGHKGHLQIVGFDCRNLSVESSGLCSAHNAWSKINKVSTIVNNDSGCRTGTIRIGNRRAGAEEYHLRPARAYLRRLARWLLRCGCYRHQHQSREAHNPVEFHGICRLSKIVPRERRLPTPLCCQAAAVPERVMTTSDLIIKELEDHIARP